MIVIIVKHFILLGIFLLIAGVSAVLGIQMFRSIREGEMTR